MANFISNAKTLRLENEINNSAALSIKDKSSVAFMKARDKLITDFYILILEQRGKKVENFDEGLELTNAVDHCLENYDSEKGEFINFVLKNMWGYSMNRTNKELTITSRLVDLSSDNSSDTLSAEDKIDYLSYMQDESENSNEASFVDEIFDDYNVNSIFEAMTNVYFSLQKRTRALYSAVLTGIIYDSLNSRQFTTCNVLDLPFIDKQAFNHALKNGKSYSQRELAHIFGVEESNLSRAVKGFMKAIRSEVNHDDWAA